MRPFAVVFVHGLFSSRRAWEPFISLIRADDNLGELRLQCFEYHTRPFVLRPDRRIPDLNNIAERLRTYLDNEVPPEHDVVLVSHSQGGLVVQRFLARTLARGAGLELSRIRRIVMFACPNNGSEFLLSLRRLTFWGNPQERALRPTNEAIIETQRAIQRGILNADGVGPAECRIPIIAYAGMTDNVVPPLIANWIFPQSGLVDGDHHTVIQPRCDTDSSYLALKKELVTATTEPARPVAPVPATGAAERVSHVSVDPPLQRIDSRVRGRAGVIGDVLSRRPAEEGRIPQVTVLHGLPGSGKSHVALEIARRAAGTGRTVWWVTALRLESGMREVAGRLDVPAAQVDRAWAGLASAPDLVWRFLDASPRPWLLVFDGVDDPALLAAADGKVADGTGWLRAPAGDGLVLVTSRDGSPASWGPWATLRPILPLAEPDGALVLTDRAGTGDEREAELLSADLGGLPLALRGAADYLKSVQGSRAWSGGAITDFASYRSELRRRFALPPGARGGDLDELLGSEITGNVFDISLDLLARRGLDRAGDLLRVLCFLDPAPMPYDIILDPECLALSPIFPGFTDRDRRTLLEGLADLSMIGLYELKSVRDPQVAHVLSLHPLVHRITRNSDDVRRRADEYHELVINLLDRAVTGRSPDEPAAWEAWYYIAPHVVAAVRAYLLGEGGNRDRPVVRTALTLARLTARYLIATGIPETATEQVAALISRCAEFDCRSDDREILALRHEAARVELETGRPDRAERQFRAVIADRERVLGPLDPDTLASRHKLARSIMGQGDRWAEAERELRAIVAAEADVRGPEHPDTLVIRHTLARAVLNQPNGAAEAEAMTREILAVRLRDGAGDHPETLSAWQTLARSLMELLKYEDALIEIASALQAAGTARRDRPEVLRLRYTRAQVYLRQSRTDDALAELDALHPDVERVLGEAHALTQLVGDTRRRLRQAGAPEGG